MFSETGSNQTGETPVIHPADMLMQAFKDETSASETLTRMHTFLEEALKVHGMRLDEAMRPELFLLLAQFWVPLVMLFLCFLFTCNEFCF